VFIAAAAISALWARSREPADARLSDPDRAPPRMLGDVADLSGQIGRHQVHVVGEILPGAGDAFNISLAAELAFGADLAGNTRDFRGE
jgi:hypothetical protein